MDFVYFDVDEQLRETTMHGSEDFPVAIYLQEITKKRQGVLPLHWHEEVQFVLQQQGATAYKINDQNVLLRQGDILFINSKCLHTARAVDGEDCCYICVDFHPKIIYGFAGSRINHQLIHPFLIAQKLQHILFSDEIAWHRRTREILGELTAVFEGQAYGYELAVQGLIVELWLNLIQNCRDQLEDASSLSLTMQERMGRMLDFIQHNYHQEISLLEIAASANISQGECCRFFKKMTGLSPITYLVNFRIAKSTSLLASTDKSITETATLCGFGSASYYTERFKKLMNCKPSEYRKRYSNKAFPSD